MTNVDVKNHRINIAKNILKIDSINDDSLYLIISESILAITFVTMIEEEFDIEFDDDDIDVDFFNSFDEIMSRMNKYL